MSLDKLKALAAQAKDIPPPRECFLHYPTGVPVLDFGGCLGLPAGRVVHLYGEAETGKTTIALQAIAEIQRAGWQVGYVDWQLGFIPEWATHLGVDLDQVLLMQPDSQQAGLKAAQEIIKAKVPLLVLDGCFTPSAKETSAADIHALWANYCPGLKEAAVKSGTAILCLSALVRHKDSFARDPKDLTPSAMKYIADRRIKLEKGSNPPVIRYKIEKDKFGPNMGFTSTYNLPVP